MTPFFSFFSLKKKEVPISNIFARARYDMVMTGMITNRKNAGHLRLVLPSSYSSPPLPPVSLFLGCRPSTPPASVAIPLDAIIPLHAIIPFIPADDPSCHPRMHCLNDRSLTGKLEGESQARAFSPIRFSSPSFSQFAASLFFDFYFFLIVIICNLTLLAVSSYRRHL